MSTNTVRLHRVLRTTPDRLYRAFLDPAAWAKWLPPHGFTCTVDKLEPRVEGKWHAAFTNHTTGGSHSFGGTYLELVPGRKLRYTSRFDDPALAGEMTTTVTITAGAMGTTLEVVQEGIPPQIPVDACYMGWQQSLQLLQLLVEPEIPAGA